VIRQSHASLILVAAALAACGGTGQSGTPGPSGPALQAVEATLTAAAASIVPATTLEPEPLGATPLPTTPPLETAPAPLPVTCQHDLLFLSDLTVPDGSVLGPGQAFDKRWQVQNSGTCAWGPDFRIVLVAGDALGAPAELALYPALPGAEGIVRVQMAAPQVAGDYAGTWQARDPEGNLFGNKMWVRVTVATP
jgi:hypothetical protein